MESHAPEASDPQKSEGSGDQAPVASSDENAAFQNASAYDRNPAPEACPQRVVVSGAEDVQESSMGTYVKTSTLSVGAEGTKPIYQLSGGFGTPEHFLYYWQDYGAWRIGADYSSVMSTITTPSGATLSCPSLVPAGSWLAWTGSRFTPYPNITVIAEESTEQTWQEFYANNIGVLLILLLTLTVFVCLHVFERRWRRKTKILEQMSDVMHDAQQFSVNLVRHFMPTMSVEKYQFRGMKSRKVQVDIAFKNLGLTLPSGASVLEGVTGEFKAGKLCAILGPSGAGKTTFMNALCGKASYGTTSGEVIINGVPGDISSIQSVTGFVPQDDIVHEQLTVREQIRFSAELRNEVGTTKRRLAAITEDVLNVMQLLSVQGSIVGGVRKRGISGGQRKRVNVGLELAAQPTVLFLDEPTSGLDSTSSLAVVLSLKKMCELGMTSIMVIHQPRYSLFTLFSQVLLLGKGGHTVYLGPSTGAKAYFENLGFAMPQDENPADWFMDVICGEVSNSFHSNFAPPMLWEWWSREIENRSEQGGRLRAGSEFDKEVRQMDDADDRQMLAHHLDHEWENVDTNRDGVLDFDEMKLLMATCARQVPSDEVVSEIMQRMSKTPDSVTKQEFIEFLMCLRRSVAEDMAAVTSEQSRTFRDARAGRRNFAAMALQSIAASRGATASGSLMTDSDEDSGSDDESDSDEHGELNHNNSPSKARELRRRTPGFSAQLRPLFERSLVLFTRKDDLRLGFLAALSLGAIVLAVNDRYICEVPRWEANAYLNTHTALSLLTSIFCLATYGADQPVFLRDRASGQNVFAYWLSRQIVDIFDLVLQTVTFCSLYFVIYQPRIGFGWYFCPFWLVAWAASGWGYVISTMVPPEHGAFITALLIFVVCGLFGNPANLNQFFESQVMEVVVSCVSITRWSVGMSFLYANEAHPEAITEPIAQGTFELEMRAFSGGWGGEDDYWMTSVFALFMFGCVLRFLSLMMLLFLPRNRYG
jgi:ABC-type multidrug transport system ATPase subunit